MSKAKVRCIPAAEPQDAKVKIGQRAHVLTHGEWSLHKMCVGYALWAPNQVRPSPTYVWEINKGGKLWKRFKSKVAASEWLKTTLGVEDLKEKPIAIRVTIGPKGRSRFWPKYAGQGDYADKELDTGLAMHLITAGDVPASLVVTEPQDGRMYYYDVSLVTSSPSREDKQLRLPDVD